MENKSIIIIKKPSPQQLLVENNLNKPDLLSDELMHFGTPGMKWGVRRYQNKDGTLTALGKAHLATLRASNPKKAKKFEVAVLKSAEKIKSSNAKKRAKNLKKAQKALKLKKLQESDEYKKKQAKKEAKAAERKQKIKNYMSTDPNKERLKKKYVKQGPAVVAKHVNMYNEKELNDIWKKYDWENRLKQQSQDRSSKSEESLRRLLRAGDYANDLIKWINSPAGKTLRQTLGFEDYYKNKFNYSPYFMKGKKGKK